MLSDSTAPHDSPQGNQSRRLPRSELDGIWREFLGSRSQRIRNQLVEHYYYLVKITAQRRFGHLPSCVSLDDLRQEGAVALAGAVDRYDPGMGAEFVTYAISTIHYAMLYHLRQVDWAPRSVRAKQRKIDLRDSEMEYVYGSERPAVSDTMRRYCVGVEWSTPSMDDYRRDSAPYSLVSLSAALEGSGGLAAGWEEPEDPEVELLSAEAREQMLEGVSERERALLLAVYVEKQPVGVIARAFGLPRSQVRSMAEAVVARLKRAAGFAPLAASAAPLAAPAASA